MIFASMVFIMLLLAIASVAWPLLRQANPAHGINKAAFRAHYKQLRALEQQLERGELDTDGYLAARRQMEDTFQASLSEPEHGSPSMARARPRRWTALVASILIPLLAVGLYLAIGNWRLATGSEQAAAQRSINQMVEDLARRLETTDSGDAKGWTMLGRSYVVMGRYADAVPAYAHAYALSGDGDPELLADYAEAMVLADPKQLTQSAAPLLEKALTVAPDNAKALWYGGLLALQRHDKALAIRRWQKILQQNPSSGIRQMIEQRIKDAGGSVALSVPSPSGKLMIPVHVTLASHFAHKLPSGATLFVFVRSADNSNGPPLLAERLPLAKLPVDLKLTGADAMMPGASLSGYRQLEVVARVSRSGDAVAQPGDMEGTTVYRMASRPAVANVAINTVIR